MISDIIRRTNCSFLFYQSSIDSLVNSPVSFFSSTIPSISHLLYVALINSRIALSYTAFNAMRLKNTTDAINNAKSTWIFAMCEAAGCPLHSVLVFLHIHDLAASTLEPKCIHPSMKTSWSN